MGGSILVAAIQLLLGGAFGIDVRLRPPSLTSLPSPAGSKPAVFNLHRTESNSVSNGLVLSSRAWLQRVVAQCNCTLEAAKSRAQCRSNLQYPINACRPTEPPMLAKAFQIYKTAVSGDCTATAIQASRCDRGISPTWTTECAVTRFDGFTQRVGGTPGVQFHDEHPPVTADALSGKLGDLSGNLDGLSYTIDDDGAGVIISNGTSSAPEGVGFVDPFTRFTIPLTTIFSDCGLLLTLTGANKPTFMMRTQLLVTQMTVCEYISAKGLVMPDCSSEEISKSVAAHNVEMGSSVSAPARGAKCEIRLDVPKPADATHEKYLALPMALAALSEICQWGKWDQIKPGETTKVFNDCKINHAGNVLAAGLQYVGESSLDLENIKKKRHGLQAHELGNVSKDVADAFLGCPWKRGHSGTDDILKCMDGHSCNIQYDGWDCCTSHGGRAQCPQNFPVMCQASTCGGNRYIWPMHGPTVPKPSEHCCELDCSNYQEARQCKVSTILAPVEKDYLESQLFQAYQLGFPGAIIALENKPMLSSMVSVRGAVVQQTFHETVCNSFDCVVDQMMR